MQSQRLRWLVNAQGPFVSVFFDDSRDTAEAVEHLETTWEDIRKALEAQDAGDGVIAKLEEAVLHFRPAVGRRGRAVIATTNQVLVNEHLTTPPPATEVRVSEYPYVVPLVELEMQRPTYVFAAVDHTGADITLYQGGSVSATNIEGGGFPVHNPVSAGWNGYGDLQHSTEEAIRMNCREIADALTRLVDEADPEVVFLCGEVSSLADLDAQLPRRVAKRVSKLHAGARKSGIDEEKVRELTSAEFARRRSIEMAGVAERFEAETGRGSGLAAEGLTAVCAALRDGDVDTLIVGEVGEATVVTGEALTTVAPDADTLSDLGEAVRRVARADEALPFAAIAVGAALVRAEGRITPKDGVGALLRYAATDRLAGQQ